MLKWFEYDLCIGNCCLHRRGEIGENQFGEFEAFKGFLRLTDEPDVNSDQSLSSFNLLKR